MSIDVKGQIREGIFIERENRFKASILVDGSVCYAHVPNTGRMVELLKKGVRVIVRKSERDNRLTGWDLLMVYKGDVLTCIDSRLPNDLIYNEIKSGRIRELQGYDEIKREVRYKNSRFDIYLSGNHKRALVEVKCVTLFENGIARFPDAPTERGRKHIRELMDAKNHGIDCAVVFAVFSDDAYCFRPNDEMDREFGMLLREAYIRGISIHAYSCIITPENIELGRRLYVTL